MHLEKLFELYLGQAKNRVLTLGDNERRRACQWIKYIELVSNPDEEVKLFQLHSLKLLLLSLESNCFTGPFEEPPVDEKEFAQYDWKSYELSDFSNMIRSKLDKERKCPKVSYAVSGNRRELVSYQEDPSTNGQHCYYACSKQPIEEWKNLQGDVIRNESIDQWKERGEYEELNRNDFQNSSIDIPRCVMHATNSGADLTLNVERNSDRNPSQCQWIQNSSINESNYVTAGPSKQATYQKLHIGRPETPQRFGGRGQVRPYEFEQFGLSQNEQFRSPRGVFQNLDYDRFQSHRSPKPSRLTNEVIESFENARIRRGPLNEVKCNNVSEQLCARYQKIRDGMNKKPQVEIEQEIEIEPEIIVPYEPIILQEPCEVTSLHQQTEEDLGILSEEEMYDDDLFANPETSDPKTIFKTKDENLVSRNVVKIKTNTTINDSKREVTEEILEQEDVNVIERTDEDENLVDVSEPTFESSVGRAPLQLNDHIKQKSGNSKLKTRRVLADYSDLPQEDLEDISRPSLQQDSFSKEQEDETCQYIPQEQNRFYSKRQQNRLQKSNFREAFYDVDRPVLSSTVNHPSRRGRRFAEVENSERLENVSQPLYASSCENTMHRQFSTNQESERLDDIKQPEYQSFEESTMKARKNQRPSSQRPLVQTETLERLDQITQPSFGTSYNDSSVKTGPSRGISPHKHSTQVEISERLDEVSQPNFSHSIDVSNQDYLGRTRCPTRQMPLPQVETSERLDEVSHPRFLSSIEDNYQDSRRNKCPTSKRAMPEVDMSERLDQIRQPRFEDSYQNSTVPSRRGMSQQRQLPQAMTSEKLDEVSQPGFLHSTGVSHQNSTRRTRCPTNQRPLPQVETSERLDLVSHPEYLSSFEDTYEDPTSRKRQLSSQRVIPQVDTFEKLYEVSQPSFGTSFQDSTVPSSRSRGMSQQKHLPQSMTSEKLDEVSQPGFLHSTEVSHQDSIRKTRCPTIQRGFPQVETSERLDQVCHPEYLSSFENTYQEPRSRNRHISSQRAMPQVNTSEKVDDVSNPCFEASYPDSTVPSRRGRVMLTQRHLTKGETSERLDEVSEPRFLHSTEVSYQNNTRGTNSPRSHRPMPQVETSIRLDNASHPEFSSSIEDTNDNPGGRFKCPPQVELSERLDQVSQPTYMTSYRDSSLKSEGRRGISTYRPLPQVETCERLDQVSQPKYLSSIDDSRYNQMQYSDPNVDNSQKLKEVCHPELMSSYEDNLRSRDKRQTLVPGILPHAEESEWLDDVCHPKYPSSFQKSATQSTGISRQTLKQKEFPPVRVSERLDNISQPEFPSSSFEDNIQRSKGQTQDRFSFPTNNVSERLDDISQPYYPSSFEDSMHRSRENEQGTIQSLEKKPSEILDEVCQQNFLSKEVESTQAPRRPVPQVDEVENMDAVIQPDLSSFEDTGYGSKDTLHPDSQRNFAQIEDLERLEDISQPNYHSYEDTILRSRERRHTQEKRPFTFIDTSERLDNICQPDFPNSFEDSIRSGQSTRQLQAMSHAVESQKLCNVCQPSFQSSFEDSYCRPKRSIQTPHSDYRSSFQEPSQMSNRRNQDLRQRLLSRMYAPEILDDVSQPFYPSSFEDSMCEPKSRHLSTQRTPDSRSSRRHFQQVSESEHLDNVTQPVFQSSFEETSHNNRHMGSQRRPRNKINTAEKLNDVSEPLYPTSFEDSMNISGRHIETTNRRQLPIVDGSEKLEDICQPSFGYSFEESSNSSRRRDNMPTRKPFNQVEDSEKLDDVSQPQFASSFKNSTAITYGSSLYPSHTKDCCFKNSKQISFRNRQPQDNRPFPQIDTSERLNDISQPDYASSFEKSDPISMCLAKQRSLNPAEFSKQKSSNHTRQQRYPVTEVSERLDDVCQPSFPFSVEDSTQCSRINKSRDNEESFYREMQQNEDQINFPCSFDRSDRKSRRLPPQKPHQFDTSEILEDVMQLDFPSTFQDSTNVSNERRRTAVEKRAMPQIDISENIDSVCQPEFPVSFENSSRNDGQNASSTYRKNKDYMHTFPEENLCEISAPTLHSNYEDSMQRGHGSSYLPQENLEDISRPSFQTTPIGYEDFQSSRGPPRQRFPRQDSKRNNRVERPGDFRQVFESMPNYAPFEQQVASKRNPIASRIKMPITFRSTIDPLPREDFHANRMRPQMKSEVNPYTLQIPSKRNEMEPGHPARTFSSTRIPLPPSARSRTKIQNQGQRSKIEKTTNQERLVKKSSVKFHQTKSTYFKNNQEKPNRNQSSRR